jgi:hypothetical protein
MRFSNFYEFNLRLGEGDIEAPLPPASALQQKLQCNRCLAGSRIPFDEVEMVGSETTA